MAAHMIAINGKEYAADGGYAEQPGAGAARPTRLLYSYFTAGKCGFHVELINLTAANPPATRTTLPAASGGRPTARCLQACGWQGSVRGVGCLLP